MSSNKSGLKTNPKQALLKSQSRATSTTAKLSNPSSRSGISTAKRDVSNNWPWTTTWLPGIHKFPLPLPSPWTMVWPWAKAFAMVKVCRPATDVTELWSAWFKGDAAIWMVWGAWWTVTVTTQALFQDEGAPIKHTHELGPTFPPRCAIAQHHQTTCAAKSHSRALPTFRIGKKKSLTFFWQKQNASEQIA